MLHDICFSHTIVEAISHIANGVYLWDCVNHSGIDAGHSCKRMTQKYLKARPNWHGKNDHNTFSFISNLDDNVSTTEILPQVKEISPGNFL